MWRAVTSSCDLNTRGALHAHTHTLPHMHQQLVNPGSLPLTWESVRTRLVEVCVCLCVRHRRQMVV